MAGFLHFGAFIVAMVFIILGFGMDVIGMMGILKWNRTGRGQSGLPLVPLVLYYGAGYLLPEVIMSVHRGFYIIPLVCFHIAVHFLLPWVDRLILKHFKWYCYKERANNITKRFFAQGQINYSGTTGSTYYYTFDHLGSVRAGHLGLGV